jgi:hypothetical protein
VVFMYKSANLDGAELNVGLKVKPGKNDRKLQVLITGAELRE